MILGIGHVDHGLKVALCEFVHADHTDDRANVETHESLVLGGVRLAFGLFQIINILCQESIDARSLRRCVIVQPSFRLSLGICLPAPPRHGAGKGFAHTLGLHVDLPAAAAFDPRRLAFSFCHKKLLSSCQPCALVVK